MEKRKWAPFVFPKNKKKSFLILNKPNRATLGNNVLLQQKIAIRNGKQP